MRLKKTTSITGFIVAEKNPHPKNSGEWHVWFDKNYRGFRMFGHWSQKAASRFAERHRLFRYKVTHNVDRVY